MMKTSQTHPLLIGMVNVPGTNGVIGMTLCPGKVQANAMSGQWQRDLDLDLQVIQEWGANNLITLMEPHELKRFQVQDLPERVAKQMKHLLLPIVDTSVPDEAWEKSWCHVGPEVRASLQKGEKVLIHCLGGLGRTGTLAARLLIEFGMEPEKAIKAVRKARPGAIENATQEGYVKKLKTMKQLETPTSRPYHRIAPDRASRFRGCLLGGAVGDALGAPVEFMDLPAIQAKFGPDGIRDFVPAYGRLGAITDDTQMTLFTAEGLLRAHVREGTTGRATVPGLINNAYLRWLITQGSKSKVQGLDTDGWLFGHEQLFSRRAPGNTCLSALQNKQALGDSDPAVNDSKGCGGVMRVAPIGLYVAARRLPSEQAFTWGCEACALTHGHPSGQLPGGVMAMLVAELVQGRELPEAVSTASEVLKRTPQHEETQQALEAAMRLASSSLPTHKAIPQLGEGWVAEEALAISLYCALKARTLEEGVTMAVNITGDSDSTGAITGNLLGAMLGVHEVPDRWLESLELKPVLTAMADDLATVEFWALSEFHQDTPEKVQEQNCWLSRYPGR